MNRLLVSLLAIAVIGGTCWGWNQYNQSIDQATARGVDTTTASPSEAVEPEQETLVVLGDSYMEGTGAAPGADMATLVADELGHELVNLSAGGTGYLNAGPAELNREPFPDRVDEVAELEPDLTIVAGGLNDYGYIFEQGSGEIDDQREAVERTLRAVKRDSTDVLVLGPFWPNGGPPPGALELDQVIKETADELGLDFVSPIEQKWITGIYDEDTGNVRQYIGPDRTHPTPSGHEYLAQRVLESIAERSF